MESHISLFRSKMQNEGLPVLIIDTFEYYYNQICSGTTGYIRESDVVPIAPSGLMTLAQCMQFRIAGELALAHTVTIKLNGGLGTSMGLNGPKSLLKVNDKYNFIDIAMGNGLKTGNTKNGIPVILMNSYNTHAQTMEYLKNREAAASDLPGFFLQHKFPKITKSSFEPVTCPANPELEWNPPGHGNIYSAMITSNILSTLLSKGIKYAFVSNIDNLGASLNIEILGCFAKSGAPFMMEVVERTASDRKGGHLAKHSSEKLILREIAQAAPEDIPMFQDIEKHRYFNTNNIWINLEQLNGVLAASNGILKLPVISNEKKLDTKDKSSQDIIQIETAMGAAIGVFENSKAILVPRSRFNPVKKCDDLLAIRSDCCTINSDFTFEYSHDIINGPVPINLDEKHYKNYDDMKKHFPKGIPSLRQCTSLSITGSVIFGANVKLTGDVKIVNNSNSPAVIPDNAILEGEVGY